MFLSKLLMEALPNLHLLGTLTIAYTAVYRRRALIPIYLYVLLLGVYMGFSPWWFFNLYIWALLWGAVMLLPRRMPRLARAVVYPALAGLHGLAFGALCAPAQALLFHLNFEQTLAWIAAGFPFDLIHAVGNLAAGLLALPTAELLGRMKAMHHTSFHSVRNE